MTIDFLPTDEHQDEDITASQPGTFNDETGCDEAQPIDEEALEAHGEDDAPLIDPSVIDVLFEQLDYVIEYAREDWDRFTRVKSVLLEAFQ